MLLLLGTAADSRVIHQVKEYRMCWFHSPLTPETQIQLTP